MRKILASAILAVLVLAPLTASAAGISFGGRVIAVVPCAGGMFQVTIIGARGIPTPEFYIWTPLTITKPTPLSIPTIGGQVLGIADVPFACFVGFGLFVTPFPLFGLRMQLVGTSLY